MSENWDPDENAFSCIECNSEYDSIKCCQCPIYDG